MGIRGRVAGAVASTFGAAASPAPARGPGGAPPDRTARCGAPRPRECSFFAAETSHVHAAMHMPLGRMGKRPAHSCSHCAQLQVHISGCTSEVPVIRMHSVSRMNSDG